MLHWITTALPTQHPGAGHVYLVDETGRKLASIWGPPETKVLKANLFAAAPDLYDALAEVLAASDAITVSVDDRDTGDISRLNAAEKAGHEALRIAMEGRGDERNG